MIFKAIRIFTFLQQFFGKQPEIFSLRKYFDWKEKEILLSKFLEMVLIWFMYVTG